MPDAKSPYTENINRLADVISAIQAMGVSGFHMRTFESWAESISGDKSKADHWRIVFVEHGEFFRLDTSRQFASLVWRRQFPKRFHVDQQKELAELEVLKLPPQDRDRLSRAPLSAADIGTLVNAAISIHSRAVELQRENRWWLPLASSAVGGLIGAGIGTFFGAH